MSTDVLLGQGRHHDLAPHREVDRGRRPDRRPRHAHATAFIDGMRDSGVETVIKPPRRDRQPDFTANGILDRQGTAMQADPSIG